MSNDPVQFNEDLNGWIFWDETWADYHGPFKTEVGCREALTIYCNSYLGEYPRKITEEELKRWKELKI